MNQCETIFHASRTPLVVWVVKRGHVCVPGLRPIMFQHKSHLPVSHSPNQRPFCSDRSCGKEKYRVVVGRKKNPYITICTSSTKEYKSNLSISKLPPKKENTVAIRINSVNTKGKQITICFLGVSFVGLSNGEKLHSKYISSFEWLRSLTEGFPYCV